MSLNPTRQPIDPFKLLGDALSQVAPIYLPLLIVSSPAILVNIAQLIFPKDLVPVISLVYALVITPIITASAVYFIYQYLKYGTIDLSGAVEKALSQSGQLILGMIIYVAAVLVGLICLILPGIHLSARLGFVHYAIITENCSAIDGLKHSSKLVEGRWWQVYGSMLVSVVLLIPLLVISIVLGFVLGTQGAGPGIASLVGGIVGILFTPPLTMYYVKLYLRLQETANISPQS